MDGRRDSLAIDGHIALLAETQHGVVSRAQLLTMGLGAGGVDLRLRDGDVTRIFSWRVTSPGSRVRARCTAIPSRWRTPAFVGTVTCSRTALVCRSPQSAAAVVWLSAAPSP